MTGVSTLADYVQAYEPDIERVLISSDEIQSKPRRDGDRISADYEGKALLLVGVLKGAFVVMADLARYVRLPLEFDFMAVSSYGAPPKPRASSDPEGPRSRPRRAGCAPRRRHRGFRPDAEVPAQELAARKPASLEVAALLRKTGPEGASSC